MKVLTGKFRVGSDKTDCRCEWEVGTGDLHIIKPWGPDENGEYRFHCFGVHREEETDDGKWWDFTIPSTTRFG